MLPTTSPDSPTTGAAAIDTGDQRPVLAQADRLEVVDGLAGDDALEQLLGLGALVARRQREAAAADHLLARPAEDPLGGPIPEPDPRVEAELDERER